ncbi:MAG TPA: hypothetical protein VK679_08435 [Gemmatimonadaceae bacterium]|nr:hypothetical protein [Gemmatimonadaceae bacterium]
MMFDIAGPIIVQSVTRSHGASISLAKLIGLATGSGRLYLPDGAILTGVFGLVCLLSLWLDRDRSCSTLRSNRRAVQSHRKGGSSAISGVMPRFAACSW